MILFFLHFFLNPNRIPYYILTQINQPGRKEDEEKETHRKMHFFSFLTPNIFFFSLLDEVINFFFFFCDPYIIHFEREAGLA